jgi:hypothetical protein
MLYARRGFKKQGRPQNPARTRPIHSTRRDAPERAPLSSSFSHGSLNGRPHGLGPVFVSFGARVKAVFREKFGVRWDDLVRLGIDVHDTQIVAFGYPVDSLVEEIDAAPRIIARVKGNDRRVRNVRDIRDDYLGLCPLPQPFNDRLVVARELFRAPPVPDVVDAYAERHERRARRDRGFELFAQNVGGRRAADAQVVDAREWMLSPDSREEASDVAAAFPCSYPYAR